MQSILITGANRGIGLELAKQYYQAGWQVFACVRNTANSLALQNIAGDSLQNPGNLQILALDVTDPASISALAEQLRGFSIDILVNNAGVYGPHNTHFGKVTAEPWLDVFRTNTIAPLLISQALIQQITTSTLKTIVNISSLMASIEKNTSGDAYLYRSSKAALNAVTKSMAIDLAAQKVTVISLSPGWVKTDMGGPQAPLSATESIKQIKHTLENLQFSDSGRFIEYNGTDIPW